MGFAKGGELFCGLGQPGRTGRGRGTQPDVSDTVTPFYTLSPHTVQVSVRFLGDHAMPPNDTLAVYGRPLPPTPAPRHLGVGLPCPPKSERTTLLMAAATAEASRPEPARPFGRQHMGTSSHLPGSPATPLGQNARLPWEEQVKRCACREMLT